MEVVGNITRHHVISTGIRELVYDGSLFQNDMTISDYFWHLHCNLGIIAICLKSEPFNCTNNEINALITNYRNKAITYRKLYRRHVRDKFIVEGHKNYKIMLNWNAMDWETAYLCRDCVAVSVV